MPIEAMSTALDSGETTFNGVVAAALSRAAVPRWTIAIVVLAILAGIGQWSADPTATERAVLGIRVQPQGTQMVVSWVQPASIGWDNLLRPGDVVLAADGKLVSANDDPDQIARAHTVSFQSGTMVRMASALGNKPTSTLEEISLLIIAACFAIVGAGVFVLSNDLIAASLMLLFGTSGASLFLQLAPGASAAPFNVVTLYLSTVAFGASLLLLTWVFPINWLTSRRGRALAGLSLLPSFALVTLFMIATTVDVSIYEWLRNFSYLIQTANMLGALALVLFALMRSSPEQRAARRSMGIVGLGIIATVVPFLTLLVIPHFIGVRNLAPFALVSLSTALLPISLGIAITSRQFLGVTRLVRRGLVALIVWLLLIAALSILVRELETWRGGHTDLGERNPFIAALVVAMVAIVAWPIQARLRRRAEAVLFRDVYDYQETLRRLSLEIVDLRGLDAIAHHVLTRLVDVLDLAWARLALVTESGTVEIMRHARGAAVPAPPQAAFAPDERAWVEPLAIEQETIGTLSLGPKRHDVAPNPEDVALVTTLTPMLATALQSALLLRRLEEQVKKLVEREQELAALSGRLMQVQEEERRRLALDLHDDPLQRAILLARQLSETTPALDRLRLRAETEEIIGALRAICAGLRPPVLDDFGLVAGLDSLASEARARSDLDISLYIETPDGAEFGRLQPELETALYRVAQEALNNCIKHAGATSVEVALTLSADCVTLTVSDNGQGVLSTNGFGDDASHLGLLGMRERLQPWGGTVTIDSNDHPGTTVFVTVPMRGKYE